MKPMILRMNNCLLSVGRKRSRFLFIIIAIAFLPVIPSSAQNQPSSTILANYSVAFHTTTRVLRVTLTQARSGFLVAQDWDNGLLVTEKLPYKDIIAIDSPSLNSVSGVWEAGLWIVRVRGRQNATFAETRSDESSIPRETTNVFLIPCNTRKEAESIYAKLTTTWAALRFVIHCHDGGSQTACNSFDMMLEKHDTDIMNTVNTPMQKAYVCFNSDFQDRFFTLSFGLPLAIGWHKDARYKSGAVLVNYPTLLFLSVYMDGVLKDYRLAFLKWTQFAAVASSENATSVAGASTRQRDESGVTASVSSEEVAIQYKFTNLGNSTTHYMLQIRRSTDRFLETYDAPDGKGQTQQITNSGDCVAFGGSTR